MIAYFRAEDIYVEVAKTRGMPVRLQTNKAGMATDCHK